MNSNNQVNFALVTSNSLMDRITSWDSYRSVDESQYLDLVEYSKELIRSEEDHKITFLVVAQGVDKVEEEEFYLKKKMEEEFVENEISKKETEELSKSLRANSKNILNSIYGR